MPFRSDADRRHRIPKQRHRVTNRAEYDAGLRARGSLTVLCGRPERGNGSPTDFAAARCANRLGLAENGNGKAARGSARAGHCRRRSPDRRW
jgi:hypothetical protein